MEIFITWVISAILGAAILNRQGKVGIGFSLGAILGPAGVFFALVIRCDESAKDEQKRHKDMLAALSKIGK